jgi:hypothetical protein
VLPIEGRECNIIAENVGTFYGMGEGFDIFGIEFVELFHIGEDIVKLVGEVFQFFIFEFKAREFGYMFDIFTCD